MPALSEYANVYNVALGLLQAAGFQVWFDEPSDLYCAERNGWDFMAESPVGLLGLAKMHEMIAPTQWQEYWWRVPTHFDYKNLPKQPEPYKSVIVGPGSRG